MEYSLLKAQLVLQSVDVPDSESLELVALDTKDCSMAWLDVGGMVLRLGDEG